jgi:hypothetical protein
MPITYNVEVWKLCAASIIELIKNINCVAIRVSNRSFIFVNTI